jgi:hypothetical protein
MPVVDERLAPRNGLTPYALDQRLLLRVVGVRPRSRDLTWRSMSSGAPPRAVVVPSSSSPGIARAPCCSSGTRSSRGTGWGSEVFDRAREAVS